MSRLRSGPGGPGVFDEDLAAYERGHLRGAVKLDWTSELQDPIVRDFVDKEAFGALMSGKGIRNGDTIVLYGRAHLDDLAGEEDVVRQPVLGAGGGHRLC